MNDSSLRNAETRARNLRASPLPGPVLPGSSPAHAAVIDATPRHLNDRLRSEQSVSPQWLPHHLGGNHFNFSDAGIVSTSA